MTFCRQNKQTTGRFDLFLFLGNLGANAGAGFFGIGIGIGRKRLKHTHFHVATQLDISATARHVGRDCDRTQLTGVGDDLRLLLVLAGVQDVVRDAFGIQQLRKIFGFVDGCSTHKDRLTLFMGRLDFFDHTSEFLSRRAIHLIMFVDTRHGAIGRDFHNTKAVDFHEFFLLGQSCAGHTAQLFIQAEIVLERHRGERDILGLYRNAFFRFDRLM